MSQDYIPLATVTLASTTSSVTFSNIPATYRDLIFVFNGTVPSGYFFRAQFNGDTGSNYFNVEMWGNGSGRGSQTINGDNINLGQLQPTHNMAIANIMDYSATDKHKTVLNRGDAISTIVVANAGRWASTAAITSIRFFPSSGSFTTGSTFNLFGISA
jgi:hypothetical protein